MNPIDIFILASTKLRSHKIRTGLTVGIAGILFGLIVTAVVIMQGTLSSIDKFSAAGLNNRVVVAVTPSDFGRPAVYDYIDNPKFVRAVEDAYNTEVDRVKSISAKYNIPYDSNTVPSPISIDPDTKQKRIDDNHTNDLIVERVANEWHAANTKPFDIKSFMSKYSGYKLRGQFNSLTPPDGTFTYMKNGREDIQQSIKPIDDYNPNKVSDPSSLTILDSSISKPFVTSHKFDPSKGEIPAIIPFSQAQKLLGLDKLSSKATSKQQRDRLVYVINHVSDISVSFCYRNAASNALFSDALPQQEDITKNSKNKDYMPPDVIYDELSGNCDATTVKSDARTATQKQFDDNMEAYRAELGTSLGDPAQYKFTVRGVGVSGDMAGMQSMSSIQSFITSVLNANLGYGTWAVPADLYAELPDSSKPDSVFRQSNNITNQSAGIDMPQFDTYLVEFTDKQQARKLLNDTSYNYNSSTEAYTSSFGSNTLFVDSFRDGSQRVLKWLLLIIGGIAVIILWGIISRIIADSRRESAVFRAIGATRIDISSIYGFYVLLLSMRIVVFALVLGFVIAVAADYFVSDAATVAAQLAYARIDGSLYFHIIGVPVYQLLMIIGAIVGASILASIVPILIGARRNPINDMRDE